MTIHYQFYKYIRSNQENRFRFYLKNLLLTSIMLVSEAVFFYNSLQFNITGCLANNSNNSNNINNSNNSNNNSNNNSIHNNIYNSIHNNIYNSIHNNNKFSNYTLSQCIEYKVEYCIPKIYSCSGDESLSFRVPLVDKYSKNLRVDNAIVITCGCLFLVICLLISRVNRLQYIKRSRVQLLLTVNVLATKARITREERIGLFGLCFVVVFYSSLKLWIINTINKDVSTISDCNGSTIQLEFADKTSNSLVQSISNFFIFLYLFKDPIIEIYNNITDLFGDLDLIDLVLYGDEVMIDHLKKIQKLPIKRVIEAVKLHIDKKYPNESSIKRRSRSNIFRSFVNTKNTEILEAINEYKLTHPQHFKAIFNIENASNSHFINQFNNFNEDNFINDNSNHDNDNINYNQNQSHNNHNNNHNNININNDDEEESISNQETKKLLN